MSDKINNRIDNINEVLDIIVKINYKLKENNSYINSMFIKSLLGEPQLKYKTNVKIYDTLNFIWYEIYRKNRKIIKNRISSNEVNINKLELLEKMCDSTYDIICEVQIKILKIILNMFELYEKNMDKIHSIPSKLKKFIIKLKQDLKKILNKEDLEYK